MSHEHLITVSRYHDISCGHRVVGHESKCRFLHGHNYRFHFTLAAPGLDALGRVIDFGVIKSRLCQWLEDNFDHKTLIWEHDPQLNELRRIFPDSVVEVPFNPTAENIAAYLCEEVAPMELAGTETILLECKIEETRKCSATYKLKNIDV